MKSCYVGRWLPGFHTAVQGMLSLMRTTTEAQHRAKVITFWKKHGTEATKDAFGVSRATLFNWQKRLQQGEGRLQALEPCSCRPYTLRVMTTPPYKVEAVCALRCAFPYLGPKKIAQLLKDDHGIHIGHATVAKIIERNDLPGPPRTHVAKRKQKKKNRLPKGFTAKHPGDLVAMDTVVIQEQGQKKYLITAIDIATRFAMAWTYQRHNSTMAADLLQRMQLALGVPITKVITDNGSEFHANYEQCCQQLSIEHCWTYPKSPKMNAHCERFNRTIQEEAQFPDFFASIEEWNAWIAHYIMQYNCYRPHASLDYERPVDRYLEARREEVEESKMLLGHTNYCKKSIIMVK